jgi:hypothetical protein
VNTYFAIGCHLVLLPISQASHQKDGIALEVQKHTAAEIVAIILKKIGHSLVDSGDNNDFVI